MANKQAKRLEALEASQGAGRYQVICRGADETREAFGQRQAEAERQAGPFGNVIVVTWADESDEPRPIDEKRIRLTWGDEAGRV